MTWVICPHCGMTFYTSAKRIANRRTYQSIRTLKCPSCKFKENVNFWLKNCKTVRKR